jgi:hypothetical protein
MHKLNRFFAPCTLVVGLLGFVPAMAQVDRSLEGDKNCTVCHDETWRTPVLSIYQTKHGVKADARTPGCQSCHGESAEHQNDPGAFEGKMTSDEVNELAAYVRQLKK